LSFFDFSDTTPPLCKHLLDAPQRLPRPLFVFDQREPHMPVAVIAKANPRRDGGLGFGQQQL
jgi:hypothetical protein